jgi:hypothetical protein
MSLVPTTLLSTAPSCTEIDPAPVTPITVVRAMASSRERVGEVCQVTTTWPAELMLPTQLKARRSAWKLGLSPRPWSAASPWLTMVRMVPSLGATSATYMAALMPPPPDMLMGRMVGLPGMCAGRCRPRRRA